MSIRFEAKDGINSAVDDRGECLAWYRHSYLGWELIQRIEAGEYPLWSIRLVSSESEAQAILASLATQATVDSSPQA